MADLSPPTSVAATAATSVDWGSVSDWVSVSVAALALLASAVAICRTESGRKKDKQERDNLRILDREEREKQIARDIVASDFSDEVRGPILASLGACSEIIGVLREISLSTEVHTIKISDSIKEVARGSVPGLFSNILDIAARCRENANFSGLKFHDFIELKQDSASSAFSQSHTKCINISSAMKYVQELIEFIQKFDGEVRNELARLHHGIKTGSIETGSAQHANNTHPASTPSA